ncbi:hypothetical protein [Burkholderia sp. D-99]|uniref:hypothetical protein n=1 Tax=Burkholderia sp. D-99 TaxID=2717316 RepID=UPI001424773C|nr:hypothetical protein [Burkholderia sp. D-99]NHV27684.1 hypothetical protein [Burkholderia sp. D-99]
MKSTSPFAAFLSNRTARPLPASGARKTVTPAATQATPKPVAKQPVRARKAAAAPFSAAMGGFSNTSRSTGLDRSTHPSHQSPRAAPPSASNSTALAKQIVHAGRMARGEIDNPATTSPPADSMAAQIIAAGKRARGEL